MKPGKNKLKALTRPFVSEFVAMAGKFDYETRCKIYDRFRIECERTIMESEKKVEQDNLLNAYDIAFVDTYNELERVHDELKQNGANPRLIALYEANLTALNEIISSPRYNALRSK
jgi:hypothetical protein